MAGRQEAAERHGTEKDERNTKHRSQQGRGIRSEEKIRVGRRKKKAGKGEGELAGGKRRTVIYKRE